MKSFFDRLSNKLSIYLIIIVLLIASISSSIYFFQDGKNLPYADAISRLNISRKIIDNITPGLAQVGNVWLPLPQILMLPFIWNDHLWHSGIAGAIMSMTSFIIGGIYIYKSAKLLTNSYLGAFFSVVIYSANINILYLQTTAMSEALFLCTLSATIYYFLMFFKTHVKFYLIPTAIAVSAMTLTRYEGLAILLPSIPMIYFYTLLKTKKHARAEANTIIYTFLAILGFGLWTLYLTVIFGDPLYWKNYYAGASVAKETGATYYSQAKPFLAAVWQYFTSTTWMVGLFPILMLAPAMIVMFIQDKINKTFYFVPMLLPLAIFLFMVLTLQRNTPIVQPSLTIDNIFSSETSLQTGFNIRYGLLLLPWVAIMISYLFSYKNMFVNAFMAFVVTTLMGVQVLSYLSPSYSVIYQIPARIYPKPYGEFVAWMKENYDGGKILISASSHEDQMFEMGFDYKTYIHEGTGKYWKESLDDPPRYAKWVVLDDGHRLDAVALKHGIKTVLERDYNLIYNHQQVRVYKIKNRTYFEI